MDRSLNRQNIDYAIRKYISSIAEIGGNISGLKGLKLLQNMKRDQVGMGPYPHVTLFEAANRIMSDLVILKGVRWLLNTQSFPFDEYIVEYGNEDSNDYDIIANQAGKRLIGEAFNVAPSFFQGKKTSMLKKLRSSEETADFLIIVVNADAVNDIYSPKVRNKEYYLFVNVESDEARLLPNISFE